MQWCTFVMEPAMRPPSTPHLWTLNRSLPYSELHPTQVCAVGNVLRPWPEWRKDSKVPSAQREVKLSIGILRCRRQRDPQGFRDGTEMIRRSWGQLEDVAFSTCLSTWHQSCLAECDTHLWEDISEWYKKERKLVDDAMSSLPMCLLVIKSELGWGVYL